MTTVKTRNASLVRRQLSECIRQATLCLKELNEMAHDEGDGAAIGSFEGHKGRPGGGDDGNGHRRSGRKTPQRPLLDDSTFSVIWKNKTVFLGNTLGFKLLERLARCPNRYVTHADFLEKIWEDELASINRLRTVVRRLRVILREGGMGELADAILGYHGHYVLDFSAPGHR